MKPANPPRRRKARSLLFPAAILAALLYMAGCIIVFLRAQEAALIEVNPVDMKIAESAAKHRAFRLSGYYRTLAEKLPYYNHDPRIIPVLFGIALVKSPADYESFVSYASYLSDRGCCAARVSKLLNESIRRAPTNPRMYRAAAAFLVSSRNSEKALPLIRKAIALQPSAAPELYRLLERYGAGSSLLIDATPDSADALIQLANYFSSSSTANQLHLQELFRRLERYNLSSHQIITAAHLALRTGSVPFAEKQAIFLMSDPQNRIEALRIRAEAAWMKKDLTHWQQLMSSLEEEYLAQGNKEEAANESLKAAIKLWHSGEKTSAQGKLLLLIKDYPAYAPAYRFLADVSRSQSAELELNYLRKAVQMDPENGEYQRDLGNRLIENHEYAEAERLFTELTIRAGYEVSGYTGLAQCKQAQGNVLEAIRVLEKAKNTFGNSEDLLIQLGKLYSTIGDNRQAAIQFQKVLSLNPTNQDALKAMEQNQ